MKRSKDEVDTLALVRKRIKAELKFQDQAWDRHNKRWNCKIDGTCLPRARYQARTDTLEFVLRLLESNEEKDHLSVDD